jgi:energy-coupling factor transport system ATP-binding protein
VSAAVEASDWGWRHAGRRTWAVRKLNLRIEQGERVLLLGASGSGKSTLLAALSGLLHAPDSGDEEGRLLLHGSPTHTVADEVGLVFQDASTSLVMSRVGDEVAFGLENRAIPSEQIWNRVQRALRAVDFSYDLSHLTDHLSGGEQQRLAIADIVALAPRLWLLDEPTANLDPDGAALVRTTLLNVLATSGATLILVEHRVAPVLDLVDRVIAIEPGGGLIADGAPSEVFAKAGGALRAAGIWIPGPVPSRLSPVRAPDKPVVAATAVSVRYPGEKTDALIEADLVAHAGQALAISGANGSGKSTLALVTASLLRPTKGDVRFLAGGPSAPYLKWRPRELVKWVGTVFQDPEHQFVKSTVKDELAVGPVRVKMSKTEIHRLVGDFLDRLGLSALANANPYTLSGGEKRRLSVATALITSPLLLVLDEPTFGQDARTWGEIAAILGEQRDAGQAVIMVTHDEDLIAVLADRHLELAQGQVLPETAMVS